jgi:hypothetical protein
MEDEVSPFESSIVIVRGRASMKNGIVGQQQQATFFVGWNGRNKT